MKRKIYKAKIYKALFKGTNVFLILLMIDYITTLFSLNETSMVISKLGIVFNHIQTETQITTSFGVNSKLIISYFIVILIAFILELFSKKEDGLKNDRKKNKSIEYLK